MDNFQLLHRTNAEDLANTAQEMGASVFRGSLTYPSEKGGFALGDLELDEYFYELRGQELMLIVVPLGEAPKIPTICGAVHDAIHRRRMPNLQAGERRGEEGDREEVEGKRPREVKHLDRFFWVIFLSIAIIGTITWLAIFEHNYHPRISRYNNQVTILAVGDSELDFNHPPGAFTIWWQSGRRNVRVWPR